LRLECQSSLLDWPPPRYYLLATSARRNAVSLFKKGSRLTGTPETFKMKLSRWVYLTQAFLILLVAPAMAADWPPINPGELNMTSEPLAPEARAIYVFRQVDRDDSAGHEYNYVRIKV